MRYRNITASIKHRHKGWIAVVVLVLTLPLVPHSHFYGDDYIQIGTLKGTVDQL